MASLLKFAVSGCFCVLLLKGFYDLIYDVYPNYCEMTYMYHVPEYIEIPVNKSASISHFPYKLYIYGEGLNVEFLRYRKFDGLPVLFIPGNGGSYKQVRSSASVALRKYIESKEKFHFDFFTADFNEELSAFSGPLLNAEAKYIKLCIWKIISLYENAGLQRSSVILMGHSLGGMIAMASVMDPHLRDRISLIINLASPLNRPVVVTDSVLDTFYQQVNSYWTREKYNAVKHISVVSIGAGRNDFQVPTFLTSSRFADVDTNTLSVPSCWLTTDHLAAVWCKQLVLATVRALYDSVDANLTSLNKDKDVVLAAFKYHLLERSRSKGDFKLGFFKNVTTITNKGSWSEISSKRKHFEFYRRWINYYAMIPILKDENLHKHLAVVSRDLDVTNWVFACKVSPNPDGTEKCSDGENLSNRGVSVPGNRKEFNVDLNTIFRMGFDHVVIWIYQTGDDVVFLDLDISHGSSRRMTVVAPVLISYVFFPTLITEATPIGTLAYNVSITGITESWQSFLLSINELHGCDHSTKLPIVNVRPSWKKQWEVVLFGPSNSDFIIEVDSSPESKDENSTVDVHILLDTRCTYNISLQTNPSGVFKRVSLIYGPQIPAYIACHLLLALANQIQVFDETKKCPTIFSSLITLTPLTVVSLSTIIDYIFGMLHLDTDFQLMKRFGIDIGFFPIFLFLSTLPLTILAASVVWAAVIICGKAAYYYAERFVKGSLGVGEIAANVVMHGFSRFPFIFAVALVSMAIVSCSSIVLIFAFLYYFIKVFKLYEDYLERVIVRFVKLPSKHSLDEDLSSINLNFTLMLLVLLLAALTSPGLIDLLMQRQLNRIYDPTLLVSACILISLGFIWQIKLCQPSVHCKSLSTFLQLMAILTILFGSVTMHKVIITVALAIIAISIQQMLAANAANKSRLDYVDIDTNSSDRSTSDVSDYSDNEIEAEHLHCNGSLARSSGDCTSRPSHNSDESELSYTPSDASRPLLIHCDASQQLGNDASGSARDRGKKADSDSSNDAHFSTDDEEFSELSANGSDYMPSQNDRLPT